MGDALDQDQTPLDDGSEDAGESYKKAAQYWSKVPATINGMLGGYGQISPVDIEGSSKFLKSLIKREDGPRHLRALDCGAGIGRITKHLLQRHFDKVDLVEQNSKFLEQAPQYLGGSKHLGELFCTGLQNFTPKPDTYDVIWCQWVVGYLNDQDLVAFLNRCGTGLTRNGMLVVKENVTSSGEVEDDDEDSSVTRPYRHLKDLFRQAGLGLVTESKQLKFPREIYPVQMFALRSTQTQE